jgi:iron complex transport system ATP-binding protein
MIARCLAQQTPILLLDEPGAFLDYSGKHDLFNQVKNLCHQQNKCILISSHELDLIIKYCDKILMVFDKKVKLITANNALSEAEFKIISGGYL